MHDVEVAEDVVRDLGGVDGRWQHEQGDGDGQGQLLWAGLAMLGMSLTFSPKIRAYAP